MNGARKRWAFVGLFSVLMASACGGESANEKTTPEEDNPLHAVTQPGYRASLYKSTWPADMANLNRSNTVVNAVLPRNVRLDQVKVDTIEVPFPVFAYTREADEVFILGGLPAVLENYVSAIDGFEPGASPSEPHLTQYNPKTGDIRQLDFKRGRGFPYIGGALVHQNGFVYVVS